MTGPAINLRYYVKDRSKLGTHASVFPFAKLGLDKACPISCYAYWVTHCSDKLPTNSVWLSANRNRKSVSSDFPVTLLEIWYQEKHYLS